MEQINHEAFTIVSFLPRKQGVEASTPSFQPHTIRRTYDGEEFSIGDKVTNGTQMVGDITGFNMLEGRVYVEHTWSGVGMNLGSLSKVIELPSQHQVNDEVLFSITLVPPREDYSVKAKVKAVHFYKNKVKYDLEVPVYNEEPTRIYNIDSCFVLPKADK